jgi:D-sedoheptulose 7-phosphate isomerase
LSTKIEMNFNVSSYIEQHNRVMCALDVSELDNAIELIRDKAFTGKRIAVCGNGGSAVAASHYITDWNKMVNLETGRCFNGICLSDNVGLVTAYANDLSFDDVFSEQVKNLLLPGDLLITVSGSGNSENVVRATEVANNLGVTTLAIAGYDGGQLKEKSNYSVWIKSFDMQICEDAHVVFGHLVMKAICGLEISV